MMIRVRFTDDKATTTVAQSRPDDSAPDTFYVGAIKDLDNMSLKQLAVLYNQFAVTSVKKFADREAATQRTWAILGQTLKQGNSTSPSQEHTVSTTTTKARKPRAVRTEGGERLNFRYPKDSVITVHESKEAPKRRGHRDNAQKLLKTGQTVEQFLAKLKSKDIPGGRAHIMLAEAEGYVTVKGTPKS